MLCAVGLAGEQKQAEVQAARTAGDMWKAIGKDSWVVVPIASTSRPGTASCLDSPRFFCRVSDGVGFLGMFKRRPWLTAILCCLLCCLHKSRSMACSEQVVLFKNAAHSYASLADLKVT